MKANYRLFNRGIVICDPCYLKIDEANDENEKHLITTDTGVGDGTWYVLVTDDENPQEVAYKIDKKYRTETDREKWFKENLSKYEVFGKFSADSGMTCVADYSWVKKKNPDFPGKLPEDCYTIFPNFEGSVNFFEWSDGLFIIIGEGNTNFFTL